MAEDVKIKGAAHGKEQEAKSEILKAIKAVVESEKKKGDLQPDFGLQFGLGI
jgi:hypothetical protein